MIFRVCQGEAAPLKVLPALQIESGRLKPLTGSESACADPLEIANLLLQQGGQRLCFLDVDAARGRGHNRELISQVMGAFRRGCPRACLHVGGGIRSSDQAQFFLDHGASWLLVGTILHRSPLIVDQLLGRFREHLTAAIDAREGVVQASGWSETSCLTPGESARRIREQGFRRILFSDIPGGNGSDPDFRTATEILQNSRLPLLMGGTLRSADHVARAAQLAGLQGVLMDARLVLESPELIGAQTTICG